MNIRFVAFVIIIILFISSFFELLIKIQEYYLDVMVL